MVLKANELTASSQRTYYEFTERNNTSNLLLVSKYLEDFILKIRVKIFAKQGFEATIRRRYRRRHKNCRRNMRTG